MNTENRLYRDAAGWGSGGGNTENLTEFIRRKASDKVFSAGGRRGLDVIAWHDLDNILQDATTKEYASLSKYQFSENQIEQAINHTLNALSYGFAGREKLIAQVKSLLQSEPLASAGQEREVKPESVKGMILHTAMEVIANYNIDNTLKCGNELAEKIYADLKLMGWLQSQQPAVALKKLDKEVDVLLESETKQSLQQWYDEQPKAPEAGVWVDASIIPKIGYYLTEYKQVDLDGYIWYEVSGYRNGWLNCPPFVSSGKTVLRYMPLPSSPEQPKQ